MTMITTVSPTIALFVYWVNLESNHIINANYNNIQNTHIIMLAQLYLVSKVYTIIPCAEHKSYST